MAKKTKFEHMLSVKFKTVNINDEKANASIGLKIDRDGTIDPNEIDDLLTNAELNVRLEVNPSGKKDIDDQSGKQRVMPGGMIELQAIAQCHGAGIRRDHFSASFKFNISTIDIATLARLSGKEGTLAASRVGDTKEEEGK